MRLLYFTDTHIRGTNPSGRLDDFPAALLAKVREVVHLAKQHNVTAILHGGDLFDRPDVAPAVAREFLKVLRQAPCPIYGIDGNHDQYGHNPGTIPRTMLGLAEGVDVLRLIRPGEVVWLEEEGGLRVQLTGQGYHPEIDRRDPRLDYCVRGWGSDHPHRRSPDADFALHLTHGMLVKEPIHPGIPHTTIDQIADWTTADITFGAHYHPGWPTYKHVSGYPLGSDGGKLFVHPGALARTAVDHSDLTRPVQVALVTLEHGRPPQVEMIPLTCARPGAEVLDLAAKQSELQRQAALAGFIAGVGDPAQFDGALEVETIMARIAETGGVSATIRQAALGYIGRAQEALGKGEEIA